MPTPKDPLEYASIPSYGLLSEIPFEAVERFRYSPTYNLIYVKKEFLRTFFEKAFDTKIKAAFIASPFDRFPEKNDHYTGLTLSVGRVVLFMESGRITRFHLSEHGEFYCSN